MSFLHEPLLPLYQCADVGSFKMSLLFLPQVHYKYELPHYLFQGLKRGWGGGADHDSRGKITAFHISRGKEIKFTFHVELNAFTFIFKNKQLSYITFFGFYGTYNSLHNMFVWCYKFYFIHNENI